MTTNNLLQIQESRLIRFVNFAAESTDFVERKGDTNSYKVNSGIKINHVQYRAINVEDSMLYLFPDFIQWTYTVPPLSYEAKNRLDTMKRQIAPLDALVLADAINSDQYAAYVAALIDVDEYADLAAREQQGRREQENFLDLAHVPEHVCVDLMARWMGQQ